MGGPFSSYNNDPESSGVASLATKGHAPLAVYGSCRRIQILDNPSDNFNITWKFDIGLGFRYLIRFYFCDNISKNLGGVYFNVYVNSWTIFESLDLTTLSKRVLGTPVFLDFLTLLPLIVMNLLYKLDHLYDIRINVVVF